MKLRGRLAGTRSPRRDGSQAAQAGILTDALFKSSDRAEVRPNLAKKVMFSCPPEADAYTGATPGQWKK